MCVQIPSVLQTKLIYFVSIGYYCNSHSSEGITLEGESSVKSQCERRCRRQKRAL